MPYNPIATNVLTHRQDNLNDWNTADPGQWFIGVVDTHNRDVFVVPVNVFEGRGGLNQETINNTNSRAINRYASGAPGENIGVNYIFSSFAGQNWLEARPVGQTHHACVAIHYGTTEDNCLGFSLIKVADQNFAQLKCASNSLNTKPGYSVNHSFARATAANSKAYNPGSNQMPQFWAHAILDYFRGAPFNLVNIVKSND
jgi:hypothetical protein